MPSFGHGHDPTGTLPRQSSVECQYSGARCIVTCHIAVKCTTCVSGGDGEGSLSQKVEHGILCEIQNGWDSGICTKKFADLDGGFQAPSDYYLNFVA